MRHVAELTSQEEQKIRDADDRQQGQKGREGRRSTIGGVSKKALPVSWRSMSPPVALPPHGWSMPQQKSSFLLPPLHTHPHLERFMFSLTVLNYRSKFLRSLLFKKPSLAPAEVASKKKKIADKTPHTALKRDTFCQTGGSKSEGGRGGGEERRHGNTIKGEHCQDCRGKKT